MCTQYRRFYLDRVDLSLQFKCSFRPGLTSTTNPLALYMHPTHTPCPRNAFPFRLFFQKLFWRFRVFSIYKKHGFFDFWSKKCTFLLINLCFISYNNQTFVIHTLSIINLYNIIVIDQTYTCILLIDHVNHSINTIECYVLCYKLYVQQRI